MILGTPQGDGAPLRVHLQRLRQATGRVDAQLAESLRPLPAGVAPLWDVFAALSATRVPAADGMGPITCVEMEAWQRLHGVALTPWEAETLLAMDRAARSVPPPKAAA